MVITEKKGLCSTCIHDKNCVLPRQFPVWHCEEFSDFKAQPGQTKSKEETK